MTSFPSLPLKENTSLSLMVKSTHDVLFRSGSTIHLKKAIKRRLAVLSDPIVAVMGSSIKTNKTELGIHSLLRL